MRNDTKRKLDALDRADQGFWRALKIWTPIAAIALALLIYQPMQNIAELSGTVQRSVIGVDENGIHFHDLRVQVDKGPIVKVRTRIVKPLRVGRQITILQRRRWWAQNFYILEPRHLSPEP